jgi:hypothetical protein
MGTQSYHNYIFLYTNLKQFSKSTYRRTRIYGTNNFTYFLLKVTNKGNFSTDTYMCNFICSVSDTTFDMLFFPKPPAERSGPQFEKH